jgi:hypothetical protein
LRTFELFRVLPIGNLQVRVGRVQFGFGRNAPVDEGADAIALQPRLLERRFRLADERGLLDGRWSLLRAVRSRLA